MPVSDIAHLKIAFIGPIAAPDQPPRGGFEAANRRVVDALRRRGAEVSEFPYPGSDHKGGVSKAIAYCAYFLRTALKLLTDADQYDLVHFTPVHKHFVYPEVALASLARLRGVPLFYEIRAGNYVADIARFSAIYRRACGRLARQAGFVGVQGESAVPLLKTLGARRVAVVPNFVDDEFMIANPAPAAGPVRLIYFGRITAPKGIDVVIETAALLRARGIDAHLTILGDGTAHELTQFRARAEAINVEWRGPRPHGEVAQVVRGNHFFVFPSQHGGEGQSNALTEAMALGVVPIASAQGFSASVVGQTGVVLPVGATGADYADSIARIWTSGAWQGLSNAACCRVREAFSERRVIGKLADAYEEIIEERALQGLRVGHATARR